MDDDCLERVVVQHVGKHEGAEVRLAVNRFLSLQAHPRQDRVVPAEVDYAGGALP
jgi:hypothetical protein